jgi:arylsulfatase A-like enzyme
MKKIGSNIAMVTLVIFYLTVLSFQNASADFNEDQQSPTALPNVIVVMADDLGLGDVSPTNADCKIKTPNLQAMADAGLTFLDAHTPSSVCTPTRYGLLTGRYNWRSRLAKGVLSGRSEHLIPAERSTLGHLMKSAGYHTGMIGKWHPRLGLAQRRQRKN